MKLLQKLTFFPGKKLNNQDKREAEEQAYADLFVMCLNKGNGDNWIINNLQPQDQPDITDVLISNQFDVKQLQLVHGAKFQASRPRLLDRKPVTRLVRDADLVERMIAKMIKKKVGKYRKGAWGHSLVIHGGPFDHLPTIKTACQKISSNIAAQETYFDEIWYLFYPSSQLTDGEVIKVK